MNGFWFLKAISLTFVFLIVALFNLLILQNFPISKNGQTATLPEFSKITAKPVKIGSEKLPSFSAKSVLVVDLNTDQIIFEKNPKIKIAPASLTKLATALVVLKKCPKDQIITIPKIATPPGTKMGLAIGEKITVENLLYGLLLPSGNDAADALVLGCFGNFDDFLSSVTKLTQKLEMNNTQFINPSGLPSKSHFSTAEDLFKLSNAVLENQQISKIVATKEKTVTNINGTISHKLVNLNKLLEDPKVLGIKTGRSNSGENVIILKEIKGFKVLGIVLQSQDRFADAQKILDWVERNFIWEQNLEN